MSDQIIADVGELIRRQLADGRFATLEEAVAALRKAVSDDDVLNALRTSWVANLVDDGDRSGGEIPAEEVFAAARARIKSRQ